jgi:glucose-1-phosphate adenylyltransferase
MIIILSGDHIYKMDYRRMLYYHLEKDADLTIAFAPIEPSESARFGVAELDDEDNSYGGRVVEYHEKPEHGHYTWASLTIYLFKPEVLYRVLQQNSGNSTSHEFGKDIIPAMIDKYNVYGFKFHGYWGYTRTIDEYWQTNMDLLREQPGIDLNSCEIRTNLDHDHLRDRSPAHIGNKAAIENSLIQNGCVIDGEVENSILFPGVQVEQGAIVKNSILFFDSKVQQNAVIDKVIADFEVDIGTGAIIGTGDTEQANETYPQLLKSGITLVGKGVTIPPNTEIGRNCIIYPGLDGQSMMEKKIKSGTTVR